MGKLGELLPNRTYYAVERYARDYRVDLLREVGKFFTNNNITNGMTTTNNNNNNIIVIPGSKVRWTQNEYLQLVEGISEYGIDQKMKLAELLPIRSKAAVEA